MKIGYLCDNCKQFTESFGQVNGYLDCNTETRPWDCPVCGKEACAKCFWIYASHRECCKGKTDLELINIANKHGFDFELPEKIDNTTY